MCTDEHGLPRLAYRLLSASVSTGDTERAFSDFGVTHTRRRNRLSPETVHKISMVRKSLRRAQASTGLLPPRLKRKLTSNGHEPAQSPTAVPNPQPTTNGSADIHIDGPGVQDFDLLGEELIRSAIDSRAQMEVDSEDEDDGGEMGSIPEPVPTPATVIAGAQSKSSGKSKKPAPKKAGKTQIRLADLFRYPRAPPDNASQDEKLAFDASKEGDRLRRLRFIWTTGMARFSQEQKLNETLQRSSEA